MPRLTSLPIAIVSSPKTMLRPAARHWSWMRPHGRTREKEVSWRMSPFPPWTSARSPWIVKSMADIQEWNGVKVLDAWSMACIQTGNKFTHYEVRVVARKPGRPLEPTALAVFARWDELNPAKELATAIVVSFA